MKVIVVGKGGREHALVTALNESESTSEVFCYPGSDAILEIAKPLPGESEPRGTQCARSQTTIQSNTR